MPIKRRRTRITMPPKARSNKYRRTEQGIRQPAQTAENDEYGTPRAEEWTEMVQYKSFVGRAVVGFLNLVDRLS